MANLFNSDQTTPAEDGIPSYLLAADNHNLGNTRGGSWLDADTWTDKFEGAGKLIATGILSGANSFYNTGVTVGNWFGADAELNDTKDWISSLDSDLGTYYDQNRQAADLVGFIAGSLIPGLGGVKILNAGQAALKAATKTGLIGENLAKATGLLVPQTERYVALAAKDISAAQATFTSINQNGIKALASGVWQNTLEGAAFETAVQATMFKSPILEQQDGWDITKNIAIGGALGGVIGGAFSAASSLSKIKKLVSVEDLATKPFSSRALVAEGTSTDQKIILLAEDKDFGAVPLPGSENFDQASRLYADRVRRIDNDTRTEYHSLVRGNDSTLGNMVADASYGLDHTQVLENILHTDQITRVGTQSGVEAEISKLAKAGQNDPGLQVSYLKLTGEGAGVVSDTKPIILNLADTVTETAARDTESAVLKAVRAYDFKPESNWSAVNLKGASSHLEAEARQIWADQVLKEVKPGTAVNQFDLPVLERAYKDNQLGIRLVDDSGNTIKPAFQSRGELWDHIVEAKQAAASELLRKNVFEGAIPVEQGTQAISKIVNTKLSRLEGTQVGNDYKDFMAWQTGSDAYKDYLKGKGLQTPANAEADPRFLPTYAKISKKVQDLTTLDGNVIDGMTWIKQQQKLLQDGVNNVVAKSVGSIYGNIPEIPDSTLLNANRYGAGAGLFSFSNGGYGSLESNMQLLGSLTKQIKTAFRQQTSDSLQGTLVSLGQKQEAAIEFQTINQKVTRSAKQWVRTTQEGDIPEEYLITKEARDKYLDPQSGEIDYDSLFSESPDDLIRIQNTETSSFIDSHISRTGTRTQSMRELRAAQGLQDVKDSETFRPIRPNTKDYPYFAFVKDPRVTGQGHTTMIFANSEAKLQDLIQKVPAEYNVLTKRDTDEYFQARNEYEYSRTLHESYIDSDLKNRGIFSDFFTKTNPQKIVDDVLQQHLREDDTLAVEMMRAKNQKSFDWLEDQGQAYTKVAASKFGLFSDRLEAAGKNPYLDYIKTALDISKASENPLIYGFNKAIDGAVSKAVQAVSDTFAKARSPAELDSINGLLDKYGMSTGYRDAATDLLANHTAPKGELTKFIRGANAILSKLTLGLDPLNALNNFIGANILRTTELKQITDAIKAGDSDLAGQLSQLLKVELPGNVGSITSPTKLLASAVQNYVKDDGTLLKRYQAAGFIKDSDTQFKDIIDDFTLKGTETVSELNSRLSGAFQKAKSLGQTGEKLSGNKFAEQFNRFVSADVMRQITDLGVQKNLISGAEQQAYINTFVNRVECNTIASQRPLMFQGPIGQAIGLFQSYQFNLMQQMFRYVGEGSAKDSAMLLGLQGTFYGIQGLPAFQFINQHIVGTLSGNQKHVDLYDSTYGVAGRQVGDLLLYGLPSNLLQSNLYSRGDINPRQVTVIPTTLPDVPFIGAFGKFLSSVQSTVGRISQGGNVWESMLQGLEHNGLSRPLAGLAQTLQATTGAGVPFSTTSKGSILFSNDLMSWATATRLAGGRPLDEAIINDGVYRIQSYQQYDKARMDSLAQAVKTTTINGQQTDESSIVEFAKKFAESGGKQGQFNKYMMNQYKAANTSQSQKIQQQLNTPFAQKMQLLMGGGSDSESQPQ